MVRKSGAIDAEVFSIVRDAAVWFYLANEGLSILENMTVAGVPFPQRMKDLLGHIKKQNDSDTGTTE